MAKKKSDNPAKTVIENIDDEIKAFLDSMKGKAFANADETKHMYELYNRKFKTQKNWQADMVCSICVSRTFRDLERYIKRKNK